MTKAALQSPAAAVSLDEITRLVANDLPPLPAVGAQDGIEAAKAWLAAVQGRQKPELRHPRIALFARGDARLGDIRKGSAAVCALALQGNADLQAYEMPQGDSCSAEDIAHACAYGMMAVQPGIDLLVLTALEDAPAGSDLATLAQTGRRDLAALAGALIAARLAKIPVILDGAGAQGAAEILRKINPDACRHARTPQEILQETKSVTSPEAGAMLVPFLKALVSIG